MFQESFPASYCEERAAADEAKRAVRQVQEPAKETRPSITRTQSAQPSTPQNLGLPLLRRPPLTRPNSSGFMGNIFQGLRAASTSASSSQSVTPTKGDVKGAMGVNAKSLTAEMEKLRAEQNRDADIVCCPIYIPKQHLS